MPFPPLKAAPRAHSMVLVAILLSVISTSSCESTDPPPDPSLPEIVPLRYQRLPHHFTIYGDDPAYLVLQADNHHGIFSADILSQRQSLWEPLRLDRRRTRAAVHSFLSEPFPLLELEALNPRIPQRREIVGTLYRGPEPLEVNRMHRNVRVRIHHLIWFGKAQAAPRGLIAFGDLRRLLAYDFQKRNIERLRIEEGLPAHNAVAWFKTGVMISQLSPADLRDPKNRWGRISTRGLWIRFRSL